MEGKKPLDGVFIDNEPLCKLSSTPGNNWIYAETQLVVKQRHMKTELIPHKKASIFRTNNQAKIAAIVMKKSLHNAICRAKHFDGSLVFARTESSSEE